MAMPSDEIVVELDEYHAGMLEELEGTDSSVRERLGHQLRQMIYDSYQQAAEKGMFE